MTTITIFHNVAEDEAGRHLGMLDGYEPMFHTLVPVARYERSERAVQSGINLLEEAFEIFNVGDIGGNPIAREYRGRENRSLSVGDVVSITTRTGTQYFACARTGWEEVPAPLLIDATRAVYGTTGIYAPAAVTS